MSPTAWPRPVADQRTRGRAEAGQGRGSALRRDRGDQPKWKYQVVRGLNNLGYSENAPAAWWASPASKGSGGTRCRLALGATQDRHAFAGPIRPEPPSKYPPMRGLSGQAKRALYGAPAPDEVAFVAFSELVGLAGPGAGSWGLSSNSTKALEAVGTRYWFPPEFTIA